MTLPEAFRILHRRRQGTEMANYTSINSHVTSQAVAMTLATGRARSWKPGDVLRFSVVAIRADSIISLRCFGIPLALIVWSFHEGKCPVFPAWTTKALDSLWLRMSRLCSASLVAYPREVSPRY